MKFTLIAFVSVLFVSCAFTAEWTVKDDVNTVADAKVEPPGRKVDPANFPWKCLDGMGLKITP